MDGPCSPFCKIEIKVAASLRGVRAIAMLGPLYRFHGDAPSGTTLSETSAVSTCSESATCRANRFERSFKLAMFEFNKSSTPVSSAVPLVAARSIAAVAAANAAPRKLQPGAVTLCRSDLISFAIACDARSRRSAKKTIQWQHNETCSRMQTFLSDWELKVGIGLAR